MPSDPSLPWTVLAALGASDSALAAAVYTFLTYRLVRAQSEPNVVIYVRHDDSRPTMIEIVVENIGRGLASNLAFTASRPIPSRAFGVSVEHAQPASTMTDGPLIEGIPALGPGDSRRVDWGQYGGLLKALGDETIQVTCTYQHGARKMPRVFGTLDIRSFKGTHVTQSEGVRVVKALEDIVKVLKGWPPLLPGGFRRDATHDE